MAQDTRIADVKNLLDAIDADDVAEDAAFQLQIDSLSSNNLALIAERDALLAERTATVADIMLVRDAIQLQLSELDRRITLLGG